MSGTEQCAQCGKKLQGDSVSGNLCEDCLAASTLNAQSPPDSTPLAMPGRPDRIGPYKIRDVLGKGGMGIVYLADQEQPIRRRVALKVIKLGMDTEDIIARFESERQALALMNHPNIARVYDAGITERGLPYFVMEYVPGIPIREYCDKYRLNTDERLDLFVSVCLAIQHAHQKGIIHRDIKPSNILVSLEDGKPVPKVIDFGIAKAAHQSLTDKTLFTKLGSLIGTPAYMSPEQVDSSVLDIDTRTDIYSLGVLLYEILVGVLPYDPVQLNGIGNEKILKAIQEDDPLAPTRRLRTLGDSVEEIARRRHTTPKVLQKQLQGDLDWITMKAMEKDRSRRYASASEFAEEIRRFQNQEPVSARPPSVLYKLGKFTRRHRIGITAGALLVAALIAGIIGTTTGLVRARKAEKLAQKEAAQAKAINEFMQETLSSANPIEGENRDITLLEVLENSIDRIHDSFSDQPEVEAELKRNIGVTFLRLGHYEKAEVLFKDSLYISQHQLSNDRFYVTVSLNDLAVLKQEQGDYEEAEDYYRRALKLSIEKNGEEDPEATSIMSNLGLLLQAKGDLTASEEILRKVLKIDREIFDDKDLNVATDLNNLGNLLTEKKEYEESAPLISEACSIFREKQHPWLAVCLGNQGNLLTEKGEYQKAEQVLAEALSLGLKRLGEKNQDVALIRYKYGKCLLKLKQLDSAQEQLEAAFPVLRESMGIEDSQTQRVIGKLVELYAAKGDRGKESRFRDYLK